MISDELLAILVCPVDHSQLTVANAELVAALNREIEAGRLRTTIGETVARTIAGGLVNESRGVLYPIVDGIPNLLVDESIPLDQLPT